VKEEYDFRYGRRGAVLGAPSGKTRITIRIDGDVLQWFRNRCTRPEDLEETLRRVLREELPRYADQRKADVTRR
jgi:uncharacterized protein (DUF4415 family)